MSLISGLPRQHTPGSNQSIISVYRTNLIESFPLNYAIQWEFNIFCIYKHEPYAKEMEWNKYTSSAADYQRTVCRQRCNGNEKIYTYINDKLNNCSYIKCFPCDCNSVASTVHVVQIFLSPWRTVQLKSEITET